MYLLIYLFLLCWVFVATQALSSCSEWGLFFGASLAVEHRLQGTPASTVAAHGLSSCGSQALEHRLSSCDPPA